MPVAKVWYGRMTILTELIKRIYLLARYGNGFINIALWLWCDMAVITVDSSTSGEWFWRVGSKSAAGKPWHWSQITLLCLLYCRLRSTMALVPLSLTLAIPHFLTPRRWCALMCHTCTQWATMRWCAAHSGQQLCKTRKLRCTVIQCTSGSRCGGGGDGAGDGDGGQCFQKMKVPQPLPQPSTSPLPSICARKGSAGLLSTRPDFLILTSAQCHQWTQWTKRTQHSAISGRSDTVRGCFAPTSEIAAAACGECERTNGNNRKVFL